MSWKRTFWAAWFGQTCSMMAFSFVIPFLPLYIRELGIKGDGEVARWSGIATFATGITMALFAPVWGYLADHYGRKSMVLRSMFGGSIVLFLMAFCRNVNDLVILRLLQGILTGTVTAYLALVASVTPPERSGFSLGMMSAAVFFGGSTGPLLGGMVCEYFGFKAAFFASAVMIMIGGIVVAVFCREKFEPEDEPHLEKISDFAKIFATAGFVAAVLALFELNFAGSVVAPVFPLFVQNLLGHPEGAKAITGQIMCVAGVAAAAAALITGRISDAWGHKRLLVISTLAAGVITFPLAAATKIFHLYVLRILFGFADAGIMPSANAMIRSVVKPRHLGRAYGLTASITCLGWGLGPLAGGYIAEHAGLRAPFIVTGALLILTAGMVAIFVRQTPVAHQLKEELD